MLFRSKVYFKNALGDEIDISQLSSGEKQIVYRAGYLLKNIGSLNGGLILVDEPEISFHPSWQEKYVKFLRAMFSDEGGRIPIQIIVATHSPFILQNKEITDEKIVILERQGRNVVEAEWPKFYGYTEPESIFILMDPPQRRLLLVEGESDKRILERAWSVLRPEQEMTFEIKWAGQPNPGGAGILQRQLVSLQQHAIHKTLGLFDADEKGLNDFKGTKTGQSASDFVTCPEISNLKLLNKVGATYLPVPPGRESYFNWGHTSFSILVLELFFDDELLQSFGVLEEERIQVGAERLVSLKRRHGISGENLDGLSVDRFSNFSLIFDHIENCFSHIN